MKCTVPTTSSGGSSSINEGTPSAPCRFGRCGSGRGFGQAEKQILNAELKLIRELFPDELNQPLGSSDYFVLGVDGELNWSSPNLDWWLSEARLRQISRAARESSGSIVLRHCIVEPTPLLDGQILCKVKPISPVRMTPLAGAGQRQHEIASLLGSGATNGEIAELIGISPGAVRSSIRSMCKKFGASSRIELIAAVRAHVYR